VRDLRTELGGHGGQVALYALAAARRHDRGEPIGLAAISVTWRPPLLVTYSASGGHVVDELDPRVGVLGVVGGDRGGRGITEFWRA